MTTNVYVDMNSSFQHTYGDPPNEIMVITMCLTPSRIVYCGHRTGCLTNHHLHYCQCNIPNRIGKYIH